MDVGLFCVFLGKKIARSAGNVLEIILWRYAKLRLTAQDGRILANNFCFGKKKRQNLSYFLFGSLKFGCQFCRIVIYCFKSLCYLFSGCWVRFC